MSSSTCINVHDYEAAAARVLPRAIFDYYQGGAQDESTLAENLRAFARVRFRPRVLRGVSNVSLETRLGNYTLSAPLIVAPMAMQRMAHHEGENAVAAAARKLGLGFCLSTLSTTSIEEVAQHAGEFRLFQVYIFKDRSVTLELVRRAKRAGYAAVVLTVDTPRIGRRERDARNKFRMPAHLELANFPRVQKEAKPLSGEEAERIGESQLAFYGERFFEPDITWDDISWLASESGMSVWVKGIVRGDDAKRAVESGAAAVVVSNHGARQLDGVIATIDALEEVVSAVAGQVPVLVDSGIRRGADIVRALALGASAVMIGRPILWALAVGGGKTVKHLLNILREEMAMAMAFCGARSCSEIVRDMVVIDKEPIGRLAKL